ncbi:hypothetical protein WK32_27345 [Burkholderia vietnamiensis]|nr:hypothetical protein WK32_27345 [Burkholderia vietnamiensis]
MTFAMERVMTLTTNRFRPHAVSCWVDTPTIAPITGCAEDHALPLGTVVRVVAAGVLANDELRKLVIDEAQTARRLSADGRTQIGAMVDDDTQNAFNTIGQQTGVSRAKVVRAALVVGAKHLADFSRDLQVERQTRDTAHERSRDRMITLFQRLQGEVTA